MQTISNNRNKQKTYDTKSKCLLNWEVLASSQSQHIPTFLDGKSLIQLEANIENYEYVSLKPARMWDWFNQFGEMSANIWVWM